MYLNVHVYQEPAHGAITVQRLRAKSQSDLQALGKNMKCSQNNLYFFRIFLLEQTLNQNLTSMYCA